MTNSGRAENCRSRYWILSAYSVRAKVRYVYVSINVKKNLVHVPNEPAAVGAPWRIESSRPIFFTCRINGRGRCESGIYNDDDGDRWNWDCAASVLTVMRADGGVHHSVMLRDALSGRNVANAFRP